jgi:hypothetical protein
MPMERRATAVAVFETSGQADAAVNELRAAGFADDRIGVVHRYAGASGDRTGESMAEGLAVGTAAGGALGVLGGLAVVAGVLTPIGPAVAGGALAGVLTSAAAGAAVGGLTGALMSMGVPEDEARLYEGEVGAGRAVVSVRADARYDEALGILRRSGGREPAPVPPADVPLVPPL